MLKENTDFMSPFGNQKLLQLKKHIMNFEKQNTKKVA